MVDKFDFNMNYEHRDKLLGVSGDWIAGRGFASVRQFELIDINILNRLIENKYIDPLSRVNCSPSVEEIYSFMDKYPHLLAKGYVTSPFRKDYRVSIDTLFVPKEHITSQLKHGFLSFCGNADELETEDCLYAWWD